MRIVHERQLNEGQKEWARFRPARNALRQLEFTLPVPLQAPLLRLLGRTYDPYDEITDQSRSIFIHIPRTAGTSVALALNRNEVHYSVSRYAAFDRDRFRRYFKFTFVRNPWDRLLSCYCRLQSRKMAPETADWARRYTSQYRSFEEFVLALRDSSVRKKMLSFFVFRPQLSWISLPGSRKIEVDFVGRFEHLDRDFAAACERLGIAAELPATNDSAHRPYNEAYTPAMRDIVAEVYREDIEVLQYEF